jgi:hypothetical protein
LSDSTAVLQTAARLLGEHLGVSRVGYAEMEGREYVIRAEYDPVSRRSLSAEERARSERR